MAEASGCVVSLSEVFERAANHMRKNATQLGTDKLLELYAYYKQAKEGPCNIPKPHWFEMTAKHKWEAWKELGNMDQDTAMKRYISIVSAMNPGWEMNYSKEHAEDKENTAHNIGWVAVSCLANTDEFLADTDKTIFDWVKESNVEKVLEIAQEPYVAESVNDPDENGMGLIHWAADRGNLVIVSCLVEQLRADVNMQDSEDGQTPLHFAASCGHLDIVKYLLDKGADPSIADTEGNLPKDIVTDDEILSLLND